MKHIHYDKDTTICTDGDPAYHYLKDRVHLINGIIDYKESDHLMYWINIQISNIKSNIDGIYHGIAEKNISMDIYRNMPGDSIIDIKVSSLCFP